MASHRKIALKDGTEVYEVKASRGRKAAPLTMRWEPPKGWSEKAIQRELAKVEADFERRVNAGEVISRAEQKEREALEEAERQKVFTVQRYGDEVFMPAKKPQMSINSVNGFQGVLNTWIYPNIGGLPINEVRPADVQTIFTVMQEQNKSHSTLQKCKVVLNLLFKMAYLQDLIDKNPMDKVLLPKMTQTEKMKTQTVEAFSADELRYILNCLEQEPEKWRIYIKLLVQTGCRRGEITALCWRDIDFQTGEVNISKSAVYDTGTKETIIGTPKSGKSRKVYISKELLQELKNYRVSKAAENCIAPYIFTRENSAECMHAQTPTRYFQKFGERYGVKNFHPHKLRHSFASVALTNGADITTVSELLGHADPVITLRVYAHANEESKQKAANLVQELLAGNQ